MMPVRSAQSRVINAHWVVLATYASATVRIPVRSMNPT
jgi:hypothetical protein